MTGPSSPVPADDPRMIAWKAYQATDDYANTFKWATEPANRDQHVQGALWAAFLAGYEAADIRARYEREKDDEDVVRALVRELPGQGDEP